MLREEVYGRVQLPPNRCKFYTIQSQLGYASTFCWSNTRSAHKNKIGSSCTYFDNAFTLQLIQRNVYGQNGLTMILHATVMVTLKYILSITRD